MTDWAFESFASYETCRFEKSHLGAFMHDFQDQPQEGGELVFPSQVGLYGLLLPFCLLLA